MQSPAPKSAAWSCLALLLIAAAAVGQHLPSSCPIEFQKVDPHSYPLTAGMLGGPDKDPWDHYLRIEYRNVSDKTIVAIRFGVAFVDALAEANRSVYSYDSSEVVKPSKAAKPYWGDGVYFHQYEYRMGAIVWVEKLRFSDNTFFVDDGSHSCAWPKHAPEPTAPAIAPPTANPQELVDLVKKGLASTCVIVTIPPGAEIEVDGNKAGVTPRLFVLLRQGDTGRTITIKMGGYKTVAKKVVPDGKIISIELALEKQ